MRFASLRVQFGQCFRTADLDFLGVFVNAGSVLICMNEFDSDDEMINSTLYILIGCKLQSFFPFQLVTYVGLSTIMHVQITYNLLKLALIDKVVSRSRPHPDVLDDESVFP